MQAHAGRGDGLAIFRVGDIAGRKHAGNVGGSGPGCDLDIAAGVERELAADEAGCRVMPNGDEHALDRNVLQLAGPVAHAHGLDGLGREAAHDLLDRAVPNDAHLGICEQAVLQDLLGAKGVAAVDDRDGGGVVGEVECFLHGRVAARR